MYPKYVGTCQQWQFFSISKHQRARYTYRVIHKPLRDYDLCGKVAGMVTPCHTRATCVAGTWLQDWHLPRHQGWTYRASLRSDRNLEYLSLCWHASLRRDHPGYCTAEVGNPGGTYELRCVYTHTHTHTHKTNEVHVLFEGKDNGVSKDFCFLGRHAASNDKTLTFRWSVLLPKHL